MRKRKNVRAGRRDVRERKGAGTQLEVTIERILPGGAGLAHAEGRTLLVGLAAPGDVLRVRVEQVRGKVAFASIIEVIVPSPLRVEPPCPYFGRCGGCDFQQLSYEAQLSAKVEIIKDCLRRIAHIDYTSEIPITPSPQAWHYRARAQWQYDAPHQRFGYFERGSHRVCDVAECPVLVSKLEETLEQLRELMKEDALPPGAEDFQAVAGEEGASLAPPVDAVATTREVSRHILGHHYRFNAEGFFQINHELLGALVAASVSDLKGESAIDLYCGVGLFTLPLAARFKEVTGVEANPAAIAYARRNLAEENLTNVRLECARVGEWLDTNAAKHKNVDLLLLDPPRTGAEEGAINGVLSLAPRRIAYVSCDPATLARDLKKLLASGYRLDTVAAFDMFPQTHHVETVAHLSECP
jgi:23S rRNA (uracil1939-C5)-methyltransferase